MDGWTEGGKSRGSDGGREGGGGMEEGKDESTKFSPVQIWCIHASNI